MNVKKLRIVPNTSSKARSFVPKTSSRARCFLNFPLGTKKAMSPLFSTIILIGFAIALGGIVMSWGKSGYAMEKPVEGCEGTSLSLVSYGDNKGVCNDDAKLYFTVQNNGELDLSGVKVFVVGNQDIYPAVVENPIYVADVVRLEMEYPAVGEIEKLIFVPMFNLLSEEKLCPKNGFSVEEISEC